jgi:hypothetical protein
LGGIEKDLEDYAAAERAFARAIELQPHSELASRGMFFTLARQKRDDDAFAEMRRFLTLHPDSEEYKLILKELEENGY